MPPPDPRCPRCARPYSWGTTVCPVCHVGLDLTGTGLPPTPEVPVFETGDGTSAEIVVSLLSAYKVPCTLQKSGAAAHFGLGRAGWWRVLVQAADEVRAQAILDAEIGHGEGE
jgi:hypothetical protein